MLAGPPGLGQVEGDVGGEERGSALRVDVEKAVYRLARGHQILEGVGGLGRYLSKKIRTYFSSFPKEPHCLQACDL